MVGITLTTCRTLPSVSISLQNSLHISEPFSIFENDLNKIKMQCLEHYINFTDQTNVNNFMETQLLWFCKKSQTLLPLPMLETTTKSTYFLPAKKKI